jgi:tetratricopeptide (TPR) repeat protein
MVSGRYGFRHALYQEVLYRRIGSARRVRLHRRIGAREEAGYRERASERAAELAVHFARGRDDHRAVQYLGQAAANAAKRSAPREVIGLATQGCELLTHLPDTPERRQQELDLQILLGHATTVIKGYAAPEVEHVLTQARELCEQLGEPPQLVPTLRGLCWFYVNRGALPTARELGEQLYRLAQRTAAPTHLLEAHEALGGTLFFLGEYAAAPLHLEQSLALMDPTAQQAQALRPHVSLGVACLVLAALTRWCLGYPAQAMSRSQEALALAQALAHLFSLVMARFWAAFLHYRRCEVAAVQAHAEALLPLATA